MPNKRLTRCCRLLLFAGFALVTAVGPAGADVITDWSQKAVPLVTKYSLGAPAYRDLAIMHLAMYQCVNSVEPRYEPYKAKLDAPATVSKEARPRRAWTWEGRSPTTPCRPTSNP